MVSSEISSMATPLKFAITWSSEDGSVEDDSEGDPVVVEVVSDGAFVKRRMPGKEMEMESVTEHACVVKKHTSSKPCVKHQSDTDIKFI